MSATVAHWMRSVQSRALESTLEAKDFLHIKEVTDPLPDRSHLVSLLLPKFTGLASAPFNKQVLKLQTHPQHTPVHTHTFIPEI